MSAPHPPGLRVVVVVGALCLALLADCQKSMTTKNFPTPQHDINAVLAAHDKELLATPGVVGVYVGLQSDGKTPCLKVMLAIADEKLARSIPRSLEGYPVVTEVTGEIKPFSKP